MCEFFSHQSRCLPRTPQSLAVGFGLVYGWATNQDAVIWYAPLPDFPYVTGECGPLRPEVPRPCLLGACWAAGFVHLAQMWS